MQRITIEEARNLFITHPARFISQEQSEIYYDNFSGDIEVVPYLICGCLAVKSDLYWHIHALSREADILSAINQVKKNRDDESEKLMVLTWDNIPKEIEHCVGSYKFARGYKSYRDDAIRPLTMADAKSIEECCAYDSEDNRIGNDIATDFLNYRNYLSSSCDTMLGLFIDNNLVGLVQSTENNELKIAVINIYVNRPYRNKGYAKRLLSAICATSEDLTYCYSCIKTNVASMNTAKACGFEFKGAYLFL